MKLLITRHLQTMDQLLSYSHSPRAKYDASVIFQLQALARHRSLRLLEEKELAEKILSSSSSLLDNQAAVLEISLGTHLDRLDRSNITCPLTPLIFPLIQALDYIFDASSVLAFQIVDLHHQLFVSIDSAFVQSFRFWSCLKNLQYKNEHEVVGFDHSIFYVQYRWLRKKLAALNLVITGITTANPSIDRSRVDEAHATLDLLIKIFEKVLHINDAEVLVKSDTVWKEMGHPQVPATADDHENTVEMMRSVADWSIWNASNHDILNHPIISINVLLQRQHPVLYLDLEQKVDALNTLCMAMWSTTDEASSRSRASPKNYDTNKAMRVLKDTIMSKGYEFKLKVQQVAIDISIATYSDQLLNVEELKLLQERREIESNANEVSIQESLIRKYANVQISPIAELRCLQEENFLMHIFLNAILSDDDDFVVEAFRTPVIIRIERFIDNALAYTSWSPTKPLHGHVE
jgi:hypothetical protein